MKAGDLEIGICDDSPEDLNRIQQAFRKSVEILGEKDVSLYLYPDVGALYKDSRTRKFSLVLLDWEMPGMNGFDLAEQLYIENPDLKVVFVSNYENIVFDSYEYTPLWFVRKGMLERDMIKALQKYFNMTVKTQLRYRMEDGFGFLDVRMEHILYAECSGHTIVVHMRNRPSVQLYGSLKNLEEKWRGYGFIRVHKSYLINAKYIAEVGVRTVRLSDGTELDMGKNRGKMITELVKQQKARIC